MNTRSNEVQTALQVVKDAAQNAMMDNGIKQETVADILGMTQSSVSKMVNYTGEQHLAAGHLSVLMNEPATKPIAMAVMIAIGGMCGMDIDERAAAVDVNGSIDDELLNIDVLQARIIELRSGDMRKVVALCHEIKHQVNIIEAEAQRKLNK